MTVLVGVLVVALIVVSCALVGCLLGLRFETVPTRGAQLAPGTWVRCSDDGPVKGGFVRYTGRYQTTGGNMCYGTAPRSRDVTLASAEVEVRYFDPFPEPVTIANGGSVTVVPADPPATLWLNRDGAA